MVECIEPRRRSYALCLRPFTKAGQKFSQIFFQFTSSTLDPRRTNSTCSPGFC